MKTLSAEKKRFFRAFTRNRKISFVDLLMFIGKGVKSLLQRELDSFYKEEKGKDFNTRHVTKEAFSQAGAQLKPEGSVLV